MSTRRGRDREELRALVRSPSFYPAQADVASLFGLLAEVERKEAEGIERALERMGAEAGRRALALLTEASPPLRGRLCRVIGRAVVGSGDASLRGALLALLADPDPRTRRQAAIAAGKLQGGEVEQALLSAWAGAGDEAEQRAIAAALGKVGGEAALELLRGLGEVDDGELRRIGTEAVLKIERTLGRARTAGSIDGSVAPATATRAWLHCRQGLEALVAWELGESGAPRTRRPGLVEVLLRAPMESLYRARTALRFGFPLVEGRRGITDPEAIGAAVVEVLTAESTVALLERWTRGPIRYRLEWASAGRRRGLTFRCALEVARRRPELINDPTASLWEIVVSEGDAGLTIEAWPRGLADPRFDYRRADVPAASHPTIAAALALVAEVRPEDVVWDPFVGSGTELIERARRGPYRVLIGSDLDEGALARARENLEAAGVEAELLCGDATELVPAVRPTLILTNPPLGRRVLDRTQTPLLYQRFLPHAARLLQPGGRLVWITPRPRETLPLAERAGLYPSFRQPIDMGGFTAELQILGTGSPR